MVVKKSVNVLKNKKKRHSCSSPLYILYTDNKQSSQACINNKTMINKGKQANIKHTRRDIFGKAGIKVTRSVICDLILILFSFFFSSLNIVPLIGSDCPSQSRDAVLVAIESSSASAGQCADNVAAALDEQEQTTRGTRLKIPR